MAMFKREKQGSEPQPHPHPQVPEGNVRTDAPPSRSRGEGTTTLIGNGTVVSGVVRVNGSLRIDGEAEGQIFVTDNLVVGPSGVLKAEVNAGGAVIAGRIKGRIRAKSRVELQKGSRLEGDVHAKTFKIEDGAFFQGNCVMGEDAEPPAAASKREATGEQLRVVGR